MLRSFRIGHGNIINTLVRFDHFLSLERACAEIEEIQISVNTGARSFVQCIDIAIDDISRWRYLYRSRHSLMETTRLPGLPVEISRTYPHAVTHDGTQTETPLG